MAQGEKQMGENRLRFEKSPYLLQHQHNPVHWYAWGKEAFQAAQRENKPIFLSVGYSTCHWCHVMEKDSFEKSDVADILNRHFISIKVDREERPDVDEIYMSAVQAMQQRGGWPLNVFLTPDLKPFFGGTYWPHAQFIPLLEHIARLWREESKQILDSGESLLKYLREIKASTEMAGLPSEQVFGSFFRQSLASYDRRWGGFGRAPKFPHSMQLAALLRIHRRSGNADALQMTVHTLERMARGGMYDHLGYGFARYSTDEKWLVPHFEKMLYDNALLAQVYLEAFQVTQIEMFESVAREILDYVLRVMTHPEGGFYSAEDADSEGEEGKFYVWDFEEIRSLLTREEFDLLTQVYQLTPNGNFEGHSILWLSDDFGWEVKSDPLMVSAREKLFRCREQRIHPHLDDKILVSWNGLMITAMAKAYQVTEDARYLQAAHRAVEFIREKLFVEGRLLARYREGEAKFAARLEDYAYLIQALIELYQCDFKPEILAWAVQLQALQDEDFWDEKNGGYFFTDGRDSSLLVRTKEGTDGALPNANAVSVGNLLRLADLQLQESYRAKAEMIFKLFSNVFQNYPQAFSQMLIAFDYFSDESKELALVFPVGELDLKFVRNLQKRFHPNLCMAVGEGEKNFPELLRGKKVVNQKSTFYLCEQGRCAAPTHSLQDLEESLLNYRKLLF